MDSSRPIPVLELGGSHVTAALVDLPAVTGDGARVRDVSRADLEPHWPGDRILGAMAAAAANLAVDGGELWGAAVPGPFDYQRGIALYAGGAVGKFAGLHGTDVRAALMASLPGRPVGVVFLNDAEAFGLGECTVGNGRGHRRVVCLTLGTGVGSAFLEDRQIVSSGAMVPPGGEVYRISYRGQPLEESISRRAIRRRFAELSGRDADVHEIAALARAGDRTADRLLRDVMVELGEAIGPWCESFGADALVVGGAITGSWDLIHDPIREGLAAVRDALGALPVKRATSGSDSQVVGTALAVSARRNSLS